MNTELSVYNARIASTSFALNAVSSILVTCRIACASAVPNSCAFGPLHALTPTLSAHTAIAITLRIVLVPVPFRVEYRTQIFRQRAPAVNDLVRALEVAEFFTTELAE